MRKCPNPESVITITEASDVLERLEMHVRELFTRYGTGWLYTSGLILLDNPKNRHRCLEIYGQYILLSDDNSIILRTAANRAKVDAYLNQKRKRLQCTQAREMRQADREMRQAEKQTREIFRDGMQRRTPKRAGKGKCRHGIGPDPYRPRITPDAPGMQYSGPLTNFWHIERVTF